MNAMPIEGGILIADSDWQNENGTIYQSQFVEGQLVPVREKTISDKLLPGGADCFFLPY
jgi:hypothetical protein